MAQCEPTAQKTPYQNIPISVDEKKSNRQRIMNALMSSLYLNGMTDEKASVICGNIYCESGYNQNSVNSKSGAYGICQWLDSSRVAALNKKAQECGKPVSDLDLQIQYMIDELRTGSSWKHLRQLDGDNIIENGVDMFCNDFERPGKGECSKRHGKAVKAAKNALLAYRQNNISIPLE